MKKIVTIIGARPQFIKASVVSSAVSQVAGLEEVMVHTGQHYDPGMSDVFFSELDIPPPKYHLGIGGGSHGAMTGQMLSGIETVLLTENPDLVLVYGDTNSTLAGALAAVKLKIRIAHVEAGLRSFNMAMPEEVNRILTDRISTWLFTPTEASAAHLRSEGISDESIIPVGDVMYDAAIVHGKRAESRVERLSQLGVESGAYALATVHRAENTDDPDRLKVIVEALSLLGERMTVLWLAHPRTRKLLSQYGYLDKIASRVKFIDPVGYLDMVLLEKHASIIATDSGGVQKEAFFHGIPCVTLRDETEWVELIDAGWNRLASPTSVRNVLGTIEDALGSKGTKVFPYGQGDASRHIVDRLLQDA